MDLVVKFYPVAVEFRHYESLGVLAISETAFWHVLDRDPTTEGNCRPAPTSILALRQPRDKPSTSQTTLLPQRTTYMSQFYFRPFEFQHCLQIGTRSFSPPRPAPARWVSALL